MEVFHEHPGLLFVVATLLPLVSFVILLLAGAKRAFLETSCENEPGRQRHIPTAGRRSHRPRPSPMLPSLFAIGLAFFFSLAGFIHYLEEHEHNESQLTAAPN